MFKVINSYFFGGEPDRESAIWLYGFITLILVTCIGVNVICK